MKLPSLFRVPEWIFVILVMIGLPACRHAVPETVDGNYAIAPLPMDMDSQSGHFLVDEHTWIQADTFDDAGFDPLGIFREVFMRKSGYALREGSPKDAGVESGKLILILHSPVMNDPEAYQLRVTPFGIIVNAATAQGVFYAFQSLRQLMRLDAVPDAGGGKRAWNVPLVQIRDQPRFAYRGLHLDCARHMMPVDYVKRYIDQLAYYKMNRLHWHLTDDQGWRIEIRRYPKLQETAAWRKETRVGHYSDEPVVYDGTRYGGYYTQDEVRSVVAYARARGVTVIPEIEMPGHALAALAAYPELGCTGGPYEAATTWGVFDDVFCPKEETFAFLEGVLDEVTDLFPSEYIHIGGDECPKTRWHECAHCQALIRQEGLKDEHELQSYFIRRIESYLNDKGRKIIGWDEILEGGLAPNATVMSWRGQQGGIEAARLGHDVIMTPGSPCYFDHYQAGPDGEPLAIGGMNTLESVYAFDPVPDVLTPDEAKHITGAQGNLWTEYIPTPDQADYMAYPRAIALAEVLWSPRTRRSWPEFTARLDQHFDRLDGLGVRHADHLRVPESAVELTDAGLRVILSTPLARQTIFFTEDTASGVWGNMMAGDTIVLEKPATLSFKTEHSRVQSVVYQPSASGQANITAEPTPSRYYPGADGLRTLTNGLLGTRYHNGRDWCAWDSTPVTIVLQWPARIDVDTVALSFLSAKGSWIHLPQSVSVETSQDGRHFALAGQWVPENGNDGRHTARLPFARTPVMAIRLTVTPLQLIPDGLPGAGRASWTFIDEISVQ